MYIPTSHVLLSACQGGECACSLIYIASYLQQLQGILHKLLAAIWDDGLRPNVHVKERCAEVPAVQAYADLGVCKVCEPRWEQASCQTAVFCNAHSALVSATAGARECWALPGGFVSWPPLCMTAVQEQGNRKQALLQCRCILLCALHFITAWPTQCKEHGGHSDTLDTHHCMGQPTFPQGEQ